MKRIALAIALFVPLCAAAQDKVLDLTLSMSGGTVTGTGAGFNRNDLIDVQNQDVVLNVQCQGFDCSGVTVMLGGTTGLTPTRSAGQLTVTVPADQIIPGGVALRILNAGSEVFRVVLRNTGGAAGGGQRAVTTSDIDPCWGQTLSSLGLSSSRAHFLITPGASIQDRTTDPIDEDDFVFVTVITSDETLVRTIEVTRTSATRTTDNINIIGGTVTGLTLNRQAATPTQCFHRTFELGDFAAGEATVDVSSRQETTRTSLGTLRFTVNRLWDGIMSVGPAWSPLTDRAYGLAPQTGGTNVIVETEEGDSVLYSAQYTYFWRGRRDLEKPRPPLSQRINPTIGFALNDPADHALLGLSFDAGQFVFTGGLHVANVSRLADESGAAVGQPFAGTATQIPVENQWEAGWFAAVTIDARAAQTLLKAILPGN